MDRAQLQHLMNAELSLVDLTEVIGNLSDDQSIKNALKLIRSVLFDLHQVIVKNSGIAISDTEPSPTLINNEAVIKIEFYKAGRYGGKVNKQVKNIKKSDIALISKIKNSACIRIHIRENDTCYDLGEKVKGTLDAWLYNLKYDDLVQARRNACVNKQHSYLSGSNEIVLKCCGERLSIGGEFWKNFKN